MSTAQRDLASLELWDQSLARSRKRRELAPRARREHNRRKRVSLAVAAVTMAGPGTPAAFAQLSRKAQAEVAAETPSARAIEVREGGLPLQLGSQGPLVAEVQTKLGVTADGMYGPQTDAAVRDFQTRSGLVVDGIVGPITWSGLFGAASIGGSNVPPAVQQALEDQLRTEPAPAAPAPAPGTPAPQDGCGASISNPVSGTVSSPYGPRWGRNHDGVDIAAPSGTPVRAAACGSVSVAGQQSGYGNIVCITHTSRFSTCYAHLSRFATSQGAQVRQGQVIGYVGCTGNCTGPHLHFETRIDGAPQNPGGYLKGASMPGASTAAAKATETAKASTTTSAPATTPTAASTGSGGAQVAPSTAPAPTATTAPAPATPAPAAPAPAAPAPVEVAPTEAAPAPVAPAPAPVEVAPAPAPVDPAVAAPAEAAPVTDGAAAGAVAPEGLAPEQAAPDQAAGATY
jgi:murein DD-endopeptidase MepM/ murein hydrolase activator NlpD